LFYWPSGRGLTDFERIAHVVMTDGGFCFGMFFLIGAIVGEVVARSRLRRRFQVCNHCGYDLRATPDRCPECGTAAKATEYHS
jgi:hypothetical protein